MTNKGEKQCNIESEATVNLKIYTGAKYMQKAI